ncbi:MAG: NADPH-dependent glutamate synthase [Acidobacteriota bacterium]|nr:NADPH-dependent glutamate synthase [Acidobacteriota bacterium]
MPEKKEMPTELKERLKCEYDKEWRINLRKSISAKERMKIPRQKMPQRDPEDRNKDFNEVNLGLQEKKAKLEAARCLDCANPTCVSGCPVSIDIPTFIKLVEKGDFIQSARKIKEANSLPGICGRVCPQESQCELLCNLKKATGIPVAIGNLERFVSDYEMTCGDVYIPSIASQTGHKVAVIGAGPAGLTVAGELAKKGHDVTIFEALHLPGGVLIYGIPEFRLPKKVLMAEVEYLKKLGAELRMNFIVGVTATIDDLKKEGYKAFFIGSGAGLPNFMRIPGENLIGIYSANEYLTRVNLMKGYAFPEYDTPVLHGKRVAVIGGGNVALDSVRTAKRLGAEQATIVYRRSRVEMPARVEEVNHAEEEGIGFHFLTAPIRYIGNENGHVKAMECIRMELGEPDASGRRRPIPVKGSEFMMDVDLAVVAIGQSPNPLIPKSNPNLKTGKWGNIEVDWETMETSMKGVYAGGDIVRGGATVILAMGDGRVAAAAMDKYLRRLKK